MTTNNYKAELDLAVALHEVAVKERDLARVQLLAARAEVEQLRADLREGVQLLIDSWGDVGRSWEARYDAFMTKHREAPGG